MCYGHVIDWILYYHLVVNIPANQLHLECSVLLYLQMIEQYFIKKYNLKIINNSNNSNVLDICNILTKFNDVSYIGAIQTLIFRMSSGCLSLGCVQTLRKPKIEKIKWIIILFLTARIRWFLEFDHVRCCFRTTNTTME